MKIAGVAFAELQDLEPKVRAQLEGGAVWADPRDYEAQDGMRRALRSAGKHKQDLARMVAAYLTDADVQRRTGAVAVSDELAEILGANAIAKILDDNESLFRDVLPVGHKINQPDLYWEVLVAMGRSIGKKDNRAIELYRANSGAGRGYWLMGVLAKQDVDWLVGHAAAVVPAEMLPGLLEDISGAKRRAQLVANVAWSPQSAAEVLAKPWSNLPFDDSEVAALRKLVEDGGNA